MLEGRIKYFATGAALATTLLVAALLAFLAPAGASALLKHYDGTVLGKNENANTFRIDAGSRDRRFTVNGRTEFERIAGGFAGLDRGDKVEVDAKQKASGLIARKVEPQGSRGGDDNGGHGSDDPPGDDHGEHGPGHD